MELVKYDAAKKALQEAASVDEVKKIHDISAAMKAYARQANDRDMEVKAAEIRIRAERRLGEMLRDSEKNKGAAKEGVGKAGINALPNKKDVTPTYGEMGIDYKLSARAQQIAAIPEPEFEETMTEHRDNQRAVTNATMQRLTEQGKDAEKKGGLLKKPDGMTSEEYQGAITIAGWFKNIDIVWRGDPQKAAQSVLKIERGDVLPMARRQLEWLEKFVNELGDAYV